VPVGKASWWRRHRVLAGGATVVAVAVLVVGIYVTVTVATAPELECGPGMVADASSAACVGVNLTGDQFSPDQQDRLTDLVAAIKANNDAVDGANYVSIVLLLNFSPVRNVDTASADGLYRSAEGALTAVWRANHTAAFSGSPVRGEEPKVKLFLANMGSKNAGWKTAVDQIADNAKDNHITSVVGLGQSTDNTRWAATRLIADKNLPVIGSTVTGDSMNHNMRDDTVLKGFFRVSPTNSDQVSAAVHYITEGLRIPVDRVAIVEDSVASDDYVSTLVKAAREHLDGAHRFQFTSPDIKTDVRDRAESLRGQFGILDINLCAAQPDVVYFAGRGADIGTFVRTWVESGTECGGRPLLVLTGDDGIAAVTNNDVARVVDSTQVRVQYTGLASPGKWGDCPTSQEDTDRNAYDQFQAAFTGQLSCGVPVSPTDDADKLALPVEDLDNGQAILTHDAVGLAVVTARRTGPSALTDPMSQVGVLQQTRCRTVFRGASGVIQFSPDSRFYGNPIGAVLPIQNIKDKRSVTIPPGWSTGGPLPTEDC
jgi:hypothetical protein